MNILPKIYKHCRIWNSIKYSKIKHKENLRKLRKAKSEETFRVKAFLTFAINFAFTLKKKLKRLMFRLFLRFCKNCDKNLYIFTLMSFELHQMWAVFLINKKWSTSRIYVNQNNVNRNQSWGEMKKNGLNYFVAILQLCKFWTRICEQVDTTMCSLDKSSFCRSREKEFN